MMASLEHLVPGLDIGVCIRIAPALADQLRKWHVLAADCETGVPSPDACLVDQLTSLTPTMLLRLACGLTASDRHALVSALLLHPDCLIREQTLDAIADPAAGAAAIQRRCAEIYQPVPCKPIGESEPPPAGSELQPIEASGSPEGQAMPAPAVSLTQALRNGTHAPAIAILADRARLAVGAVEQAIRMRDARMLIALCWRAGCDAAETIAVQTQLGRISPQDALPVGPGLNWPVPASAMDWSILVLQEML